MAPDANSPPFRRALLALAVVVVLTLSACGGGGGGGDSSDPTVVQSSNSGESTASDDGSDDPEAASEDFPEPVALLPLEAHAPVGFRQGAANCAAGYPNDPNRSGSSDSEPDVEGGADRYSTWITYAVPEEWGIGGRGAAGSGGVTGTDEDRSFSWDSENSSKGRIEVAVEWDNVDPDGKITDWNGDPWTSFDYESKVGDDEATITFDKVATLTVGDQEVDLFYLDPAQAPDHVSETEYRARLNVFELPVSRGVGGFVSQKHSVVVTISFDEERAPVDQGTVEKIVESFTLPACTWEATLLAREPILNVDLNGDGEVRSVEDVQKELQEKLDKLQADLDDR